LDFDPFAVVAAAAASASHIRSGALKQAFTCILALPLWDFSVGNFG
jgi:hypothetical protein